MCLKLEGAEAATVWFGSFRYKARPVTIQDGPRPPCGTQDVLSKQKIGFCLVAV